MDSDDSRPGSSASNSSSSSGSGDDARKSRSKSRSSSASSRADSTPKSPVNGIAESSERDIAASDHSRSTSPISNGDDIGPEAADGDVPVDNKSVRSLSPDENRSRSASKESIRSASSDEDAIGSPTNLRRNSAGSSQNRSVSRNQSISPVRKSSKSSRTSSVSSVSDDENDNFKSNNASDVASDSEKEAEDAEEKLLRSPTVEDNQKSDALNISHEDLSDVSDLDSAPSEPEDDEEVQIVNSKKEQEIDSDKDDDQRIDSVNGENDETPIDNHTEQMEQQQSTTQKPSITDLRQKLDERKNQLKSLESNGGTINDIADKPNSRSSSPSASVIGKDIMDKKNDEDALDFEAEEGECNETTVEDGKETDGTKEKVPNMITYGFFLLMF